MRNPDDADALTTGNAQEGVMDRIRILEDALWPAVPRDVIEEAKKSAVAEPSWIAMQGNGHVVAMEPPGSPDAATGDIIYIAEVSPAKQ
jgi:hypothetical protein